MKQIFATSKGFTLIELMITITIMGILLAVGVPSFNNFIRNMKVEADTNQFVSVLSFARADAISSGKTVTVTAVAPSATNEWGGGISVTRTGAGEVRTLEAFSTSQFDSVNNDSVYVFAASGMLDAGDTVSVCDDRTKETGRTITLLASGIVDVQIKTDCP